MGRIGRLAAVMAALIMVASMAIACAPRNNGNPAASSSKESPEAATGSGEAEPIHLRFAWWGSEERHNATLEAIKLFEERNPAIKIVPEYGGWEGFTDKMKTQLIAGQGPDVILTELTWGIDPDYYANVDEFPSIRLDDINPALLEEAKVDGKLKGVPVYQAVNAIVYNRTLFQELGVEEPKAGWTWADYARLAQELTDKSGGKVYGAVDDMAGNASADLFYAMMKAFTGKPVYSGEGIVYEDEDAKNVFRFWEDLRAKGAVTPPDIAAADDSNQNSPLVKRQAAMQFRGASIFGRLQSITKDELAMVPLPRDQFTGDAAALEVIMTINKNASHPEEAAKFIDFFINDLDAAKLLKNVRGVSSNSKVREMLANSPELLDDGTRKLFQITNAIYSRELQRMDPIPEKFDEFRGERKLFDQVMQKLAFKQISLDEAVAELRKDGEKIFGQ